MIISVARTARRRNSRTPAQRAETFALVRELTEERAYRRATPRQHNMLLAGLARCARCDAAMWPHVGGRTGDSRAYICSANRRAGTCDMPQVAAEIVEYQILELVQMLAAPGVIAVVELVWLMPGEIVAIRPTPPYRRVVALLGWTIMDNDRCGG